MRTSESVARIAPAATVATVFILKNLLETNDIGDAYAANALTVIDNH